MSGNSPRSSNIRRPHPLAVSLADRLRGRPGIVVLEIGTGTGRNSVALNDAGIQVTSIADDRLEKMADDIVGRRFDAALSTHGLLHGTPQSIGAMLDVIAGGLKSDAPFYVTFGSKRDARFGQGRRINADSFAPVEGDEAGVVHAFFGRAQLATLLNRSFVVERLEEHSVDHLAGRWAHLQPPTNSVHWFAFLHKR